MTEEELRPLAYRFGFKSVNDALGHSAGDVLLCELGEALRAATRQQDMLAGVGGDEFLFEVGDETGEDVVVVGAVGGGFVVDLPADDGWMIAKTIGHRGDDANGCFAQRRCSRRIMPPPAMLARHVIFNRQHLRMLL